jgi:recombination protein RecT
MTTAIQQQTQQNKLQRLHALVAKKEQQIARALPKHGALTADRMIRIVMTSLSMNRNLWQCSEQSLLAAVMQAAQLGLEPDGALGMASLVPYGNQCQLIIGYRGYIQLALRTGAIKDIRTRLVYDGDEFEVTYGIEENVHHVPKRMEMKAMAETLDALAGGRGDALEPDPIAVYGVAVYVNGGHHFEVLYADDVARIRNCSKGWKHPSSPWQQWKGAMWRKTAVKQTLKYCPLAAEDAGWVSRANQVDEAVYSDLSVSNEGDLMPAANESVAQVQVIDDVAPPEPAADQQVAPGNGKPKDAKDAKQQARTAKATPKRRRTRKAPETVVASSKMDDHVESTPPDEPEAADDRQPQLPHTAAEDAQTVVDISEPTDEEPYDGPPDDYVPPPDDSADPEPSEEVQEPPEQSQTNNRRPRFKRRKK